MEVSKLVQDEIDLSLELSIGGIFRKFEKSKHHKSISSSITFEAESCEINDADLRRESEKFLCKYSSFGGEVDALDLKQKMKREIQALRRQEARKKTEQKRKRRRNFILKNENEGSERYDYGNQTLDVTNLPAFGSHPPCSMIPTFGNRFVFTYHMMSYWAEPECDLLEKNGLNLVKVQQSSKSLGSGSSSVSDHHNGESNTSSDTITSLPHYSAVSNAQGKSEHADSSDPKVVSSNTQSSSPRQADDDEEPNCLSNPHDPINKTISITKNKFPVPHTSSTTQLRRSVVDHTTNAYQTQSLTHMPCVSTTGNGPNGKTINGFLYRYNTKTEVSIMCVCHGSSFTPAQFVKHAGGNNMDVSHPMKHIFVSPSNKLS